MEEKGFGSVIESSLERKYFTLSKSNVAKIISSVPDFFSIFSGPLIIAEPLSFAQMLFVRAR